jgi:hypothetical protein
MIEAIILISVLFFNDYHVTAKVTKMSHKSKSPYSYIEHNGYLYSIPL